MNAFRMASRPATSIFRPVFRASSRATRLAPTTSQLCARAAFSSSAVQKSGDHADETFEEFSSRYATPLRQQSNQGENSMRQGEEIKSHDWYCLQVRIRIRQSERRIRASGMEITSREERCSDIKQRNLNNAFAYDLVPSPGVITAALKAARRVNDYPTAVRIFEGRREWHETTTTPN